MSGNQGHSALASGFVFVALLSSALGAAAGKTLFPLVGAEGVTALRLGFSAIILVWIGKPWRQAFSGPLLFAVAVYGVSLGLMNILIYQAFARLPLGVAVAVEVTGPLVVALVYSSRMADLIWLAVAVAGLALLIPVRTHDPVDPVGLLFAAGAATCWALYIVFGRRFSHLAPARAVSLGMITAAGIGVPFGVLNSHGTLLTWHIVLVGLGVALLSSILPYLLEMRAFRMLAPRVAGILLSTAPAISAAVGAVFLGEHLSLQQWAAVFLIMSSSAGCALSSRGERGV